jgi:hypothetical protein
MQGAVFLGRIDCHKHALISIAILVCPRHGNEMLIHLFWVQALISITVINKVLQTVFPHLELFLAGICSSHRGFA